MSRYKAHGHLWDFERDQIQFVLERDGIATWLPVE